MILEEMMKMENRSINRCLRRTGDSDPVHRTGFLRRTAALFAVLCWGLTVSPLSESRAAEGAARVVKPSAWATEGTARSAGPESRASELLGRLAAEFRSLPDYGVTFTVTAGDYRASGNYEVAGESYYLVLGDSEVYADGTTRYEIDRRRREVTISEVERGNRNILNDPVHAFDFLDSAYDAVLEWERDGRAAVMLTPAAKQGAMSGTVTVTIVTATARPQSLVYDYDGERIVITIQSVAPLATSLKRFDRSKYAGYEWIDFR